MNTDVHWYLPGRIIYCYDVFTVEERIERNRKILHLCYLFKLKSTGQM